MEFHYTAPFPFYLEIWKGGFIPPLQTSPRSSDSQDGRCPNFGWDGNERPSAARPAKRAAATALPTDSPDVAVGARGDGAVHPRRLIRAEGRDLISFESTQFEFSNQQWNLTALKSTL